MPKLFSISWRWESSNVMGFRTNLSLACFIGIGCYSAVKGWCGKSDTVPTVRNPSCRNPKWESSLIGAWVAILCFPALQPDRDITVLPKGVMELAQAKSIALPAARFSQKLQNAELADL